MHWAGKYVGEQWTDKHDCLHWFRRWTREQFGREVCGGAPDHARLLSSAVKMMAGDIGREFGYVHTDTPNEGDAVFLSQRSRPHHIGMVIFINGSLSVLHALEGVGVIVSDLLDLRANGWSVKGYYTYAG